jgi:hypothetical protein
VVDRDVCSKWANKIEVKVHMVHWKESLLIIKHIEEKYGNSLSKPATEEQIINLQDLTKKKFNLLIPNQYIEFLREVNGLDFNGLVIYGVDSDLIGNDDHTDHQSNGFIESNEIWHENEWQSEKMFFGDSDIAWYIFDLQSQVYQELDKPSGTVMKTYTDFSNMLGDALHNKMI